MDAIAILQPLLDKGDLESSKLLADEHNENYALVNCDGLNFVTASILADVPTIKKMDVIRKTGDLFSSLEYCSLLNTKVFTIHPEKRQQIRKISESGNAEDVHSYYAWYNIFDVAFPWLPLSIFEDFVVYLKEQKGLELDDETISLVWENFSNSKRYSERELENFFTSSLFVEEDEE